MAFESIDPIRYIFYIFDFVFGILSWGITADKLKFGGLCVLNDLKDSRRLGQTAPCNAVIALGVIATIALFVIVLLRTLDIAGTISFPELIETISMGILTLIWLILAIVTVSVTGTATREINDVKTAIAGAWVAFFTHAGSTVISIFAHRQKD